MPGRPNDQGRKVALVTGATGIVGRHLVMLLGESNDWEVLAATRKGELNYVEPKDFGDRVKAIKLGSLTDRSNVEEALGRIEGVTHLFHCAYATVEDPVKDAEDNMAMLVNVVETLEAGPSKDTLKHVYVQLGSKWYGQHLGKYPTPAKEDDPRVPGPMLYYNLEDYVRNRVENGASWTWSTLRPNPIIGYSPSSYMNLLNCIGVYAAVMERLGLPFRFPGSEACYEKVFECCDVRVVADAAVFTSTEPSAANNSYNVSNGDTFRWSRVWPRIAEHFGLQTAPPMKFSLVQLMNTPEKKAAWDELVQEHGLVGGPLEKLAEWSFADFNFNFLEWDVFQNVTKLSRAGFRLQCLDTEDMWIDQLQREIDMKIIPPLGAKSKARQAAAGKGAKLEGAYDVVKARLEGMSIK